MAKIFLLLLVSYFTCAQANSTKYVGKIPGQYLSLDKNKFYLGSITVNANIITNINTIKRADLENLKNAIHLKTGDDYQAMYPGLIDLHNHPKQSLLPLWGHAHGQFGNRHEWRAWSVYSHSLGGNMNPWSGNGKVEVCAAFRWSELQAVVLGTTLMQGPRYCTKNFSISHVEAGDGYYNDKTNLKGDFVAKELNTQAPTDLFIPEEMTFIYKKVRPKKTGRTSFHLALKKVITDLCPKGLTHLQKPVVEENKLYQSVYDERLQNYNKSPTFAKFHAVQISKQRLETPFLFTKVAIDYFSTKENLENTCSQNRGEDFDLYFTKYHRSIVNKIQLLKNPNNSGMIAHLSEGRREDPYNQVEFDIAKTLDLISPGMNLVHAIGLDTQDLKYLKKKDVGIVWSPFSNLLLYGETVRVKEALELGINIALGSDWTPTGSKSVLEEVKIAKRYAIKNKISHILTDEVLFKMMTKNAAKMINKLEVDSEDGRHGVGTLKKDAMASFIAVEVNEANPFSNIINASEDDISLVVSNGRALYGNIKTLKEMNFSKSSLDWLPVAYNKAMLDNPSENHLETLAEGYTTLADYLNLEKFSSLNPKKLKVFTQPKAYVSLGIHDSQERLIKFREETGLDMSRPSDIQKVLHVLLTTQSRNAHTNKSEYLIKSLPSLVSLADEKYNKRFSNFIKVTGQEDEVQKNYVYRLNWRRDYQNTRNSYNENNPHLPSRVSVPYRLARTYELTYDIELGVVGY